MSYVKESLWKIHRIIWLLNCIYNDIILCLLSIFLQKKIVIKPLQKMSLVARKIANGDVAKE